MRISAFKIIGLLGSARASSTNLQILNVVGKMLPGALITASTSGEKAHEALQLVMKTVELRVPDRASLLIQAPKTKLTKDGEIHDVKTLEALQELIDVLIVEISNQS